MLDTILFTTLESTQDFTDGSFVHIDSQAKQENLLAVSSENKAEIQKITDLKLGNDWYQNDLSHMATNLIQEELNSTALTPMNNQNQNVNVGSEVNIPIAIEPFNIINKTGSIDEVYGMTRFADQIYRDILGRQATLNEIDDFTNPVTRDRLSAAVSVNTLVYSFEVYNKLAQMDHDVLGYNVSDEIIKSQQQQLSQYNRVTGMASKGHSSNSYVNYETNYKMADIRKALVYSQAGHDAVIRMGTSASGVDLSQSEYSNWVGWQQDALASGRSLADLRNQFAHEDFVKQAVIRMGTSASGVDLSQSEYSGWVSWQQDALASGRSLADLRNQFAHEDFVKQAVIRMGTSASGVDLSQSEYSGWVSWQQDALASGRSLADLRNQFAHEDFVKQAVIRMGTSASGVDLSQSEYSGWVSWQQDALASGRSLADLRNQFAHEDFVKQAVIRMGTSASGVDLSQSEYSGWVSWQQDALASGRSLADLRNQFAPENLVREVVIIMLRNMGVTPSEGDIAWTQDRLGEGKSYQEVLSQHAHAYHGREAAIIMLRNMGVTPSEGDIAWTQDRLGEGKSYQEVLSQHAHGYHGREAAINMLRNMGVTPSEGDIAWTQDRLGEGKSYQEVLSQHAHAYHGREAAINMLRNMGVTPSEGDIAWTQDRLGEGKSYQEVLSQHAHGYHGREAAINMLRNMGVTPSEGDIAWTQDRLGEGKSYQEVLSQHAHAYHGREAAINMLRNMGVTPSEGDIAWIQDKLGGGRSYQDVLSEYNHR